MRRSRLIGRVCGTFGTLRRRWRAEAEAGAAAVEFAFSFPVFVLFMYGIFELSHYAYTTIALSDAARDGVRYAIVRGSTSTTPATQSDIANYIKGRLVLLNPGQTKISVTFTPDNSPGSVVQVQLSYPFSPFMPGFNYLTAMTVSGTSQMIIDQ